MKKIILVMLFVSTQALGEIIPMPRSLKLNSEAYITQIKASEAQHPLVLKKIKSIPSIVITSPAEANLQVVIQRPHNALPRFKLNEAYTLEVTAAEVKITAQTEYGALHGLESLRQLIALHTGKLPLLTLKDHPRFPWRGLLIDVVRHWVSIENLKRQLGFMAAVKLNVLHLHLSDDQGFRLESKLFPKLYQGNNDGMFYTQSEMKELIQFAGDLGIRVIPEFDVPGHVTAMVAAYPEIASIALATTPSTAYGIHDAALNPVSPATYLFLEKLFTEMSAIFPDEYFHVGGDEVTGKHWAENPEINKQMEKGIVELQFTFTKRMEELVKKLGKKMIAWDEVLKEGGALDSVVQIWRGPKFAQLALNKKMPVLYSYGYYLDLQLSSETHYLLDPARDMQLKKDPPELWGGEGAMWTERVNDESVSARIWPRNMAVAERLWSSAKVRDVQDFYLRQDQLYKTFNISDEIFLKRIKDKARSMVVPDETFAEFISWMEPGQFYSQHRYRKFTTETPLTELVDVMPSESIKARQFARSLKFREETNLLTAFADWERLSDAIKLMKKEDPEMMTLAKDFRTLATICREALLILKGTEKAGALWLQENDTRLGMIAQLRAGMRPAMYPMAAELVNEVRKR